MILQVIRREEEKQTNKAIKARIISSQDRHKKIGKQICCETFFNNPLNITDHFSKDLISLNAD